MTFNEQLIITIVDKAAIGALLLTGGFWLNRFLEPFKADRGRENERKRLRAQKRFNYKHGVQLEACLKKPPNRSAKFLNRFQPVPAKPLLSAAFIL